MFNDLFLPVQQSDYNNSTAADDLTAVILAGGLGTRLRCVVSSNPKVLAEVGGRPFLSYLLEQLASASVRDAVLCTGYLGEQIEAEFGNSFGNMHLIYSREKSPLGTAGSIKLALPLLKSNPVLIMNGDSYCEVDIQNFYQRHIRQKADASLLLTKVANTERFGQVDLDDDGAVVSFREKNQDRGSGWINAGLYLLGYRLLRTIPNDRAVSLEKEMFPKWIDQGLYGYRAQGRFLDIGTPESYRTAESFFAEEVAT